MTDPNTDLLNARHNRDKELLKSMNISMDEIYQFIGNVLCQKQILFKNKKINVRIDKSIFEITFVTISLGKKKLTFDEDLLVNIFTNKKVPLHCYGNDDTFFDKFV